MHNPTSRVRHTLLAAIASSSPLATAWIPLSRSSTFRSGAVLFASSSSSAVTMPCLPPISSHIRTTLDPCVVLMKDITARYADEWKEKGGIYSLAQGVVYWEPPTLCTEALQRALTDEKNNILHCYGPDEGLDELRSQLVEKVATVNGLNQHDVMVTAGANQAYMNCVLSLLPGDDDDSCAVVFAPYYFNHVMALQMVLGGSDGTASDRIFVGPTTTATGEPDVEWLRKMLESQTIHHEDGTTTQRIRMVTIANPGNPTGTTISSGVCQSLVALTEKHNCWLVWDCTYEDFVHTADTTGENKKVTMGWNAPHCLHIFSFSKAYSLAGYRCGYVAVPIGADRVLWDNMLKIQDTIVIAPSRISQVAALGALRAGRDWVDERVATLATSRVAIRKALTPVATTLMGGSGAMYFMAELPRRRSANADDTGATAPVDDVRLAEELVRDFGVAVIPGSFCGAPGWIRVCYSNLPPDQCILAADRLSKGLQALCVGIE